MAKLTAQAAAQKWARNYANATETMKQGVMAVTQNPAEAAIAAKDRYIKGVTEAFNDGRYEAGLRKVTLNSWRQAYIDKGIQNAAAGARVGQTKYQAHEAEFGPVRDAIVASLPARGSIADNRARMLAMFEGMVEAGKNRRRG